MMEKPITAPVRPSHHASSDFDPQAFKDAHRVHVQDGSLFTNDHFLVVHPKELHPDHEPQLAAKMLKHYSIESPPFFAFQPRGAVSLQLATLLPLSPESKQSAIMKALANLKEEEMTGLDPDHAEMLGKRNAPFEALINSYMKEPEQEAIPTEFMNNALSLYLVLNDAMRLRGYQKEAAAYIRDAKTPEAMLAKLSPKLGVKPKDMLDAMVKGGLEEVANLLSVPQENVAEIRHITALAQESYYSNNVIENWNVGRSLPGMHVQGMQEKIAAGMMVRAASNITALRDQVHGLYDVPQDVSDAEDKMVAMMRLVPPEINEALYLLGTEFAYTPETTLKNLSPLGERAFGYHQFVPFERGKRHGMRHIYVAGGLDVARFQRTGVHEIHHLLFPEHFSVQERGQIDALLQADEHRLSDLKSLVEAWKVGTPSQQAAIEAKIDQDYRVGNQGLADALGPLDMHSFHDHVIDLYENLNPNSEYFYQSSYAEPEQRVAEIISRYSERKYVSLREFPEMLNFIAPGITQIYDAHYMPHVKEQLASLRAEHARGEIPVMNMPDVQEFPKGDVIEQVSEVGPYQQPTNQISAYSAQLDSSPRISSHVITHIDRLNHQYETVLRNDGPDGPMMH